MSFEKNCADAVAVLEKIRIVPVLVLNDVDRGLKMCEVLMQCGLPAAEITFRTPAASRIITEAAKRFPEVYLGAGTVLDIDELHRAFDSGAKFAVAPGFNPAVVSEAVRNGFAFAPGVCTPSEVEQAMYLGCKFLKFFPAGEAGGVKMLKSIIAPYRHRGIRFMPTGGVTAANAAEYLALNEVVAVGGTYLGKSADIENDNWDAIRQAVAGAVELKNSLVR